MEEKSIVYFIMSHTVENNNGREFVCPQAPNPVMGEEFCNNILKEHEAVQKWITENPDKFVLAKYGHYLPEEERSTTIVDYSQRASFKVQVIGDLKADRSSINEERSIYTKICQGDVSYVDLIKVFKEGDKNPYYGRAAHLLICAMMDIISCYSQGGNVNCDRSAKLFIDEFKKYRK